MNAEASDAVLMCSWLLPAPSWPWFLTDMGRGGAAMTDPPASLGMLRTGYWQKGCVGYAPCAEVFIPAAWKFPDRVPSIFDGPCGRFPGGPALSGSGAPGPVARVDDGNRLNWREWGCAGWELIGSWGRIVELSARDRTFVCVSWAGPNRGVAANG